MNHVRISSLIILKSIRTNQIDHENLEGVVKMSEERFVYKVTTEKQFDEAVISVLKSVEEKGWTIFQVYDLKERLAAKGLDQHPLKILEICKGSFANALLNLNIHASLCMPCRINVIEKDGKVSMITMLPGVTSLLFDGIDEERAKQIEEEIKYILNNAK